MKQKKGALGRLSGYGEEVLSYLRRRRSLRKPRVLLRSSDGSVMSLDPESQHAQSILELSRRLIELSGEPSC